MQAIPLATVSSIDFVTLYQSHVNIVRTAVRKFRFSQATTEDLVQDIFFKVWRNLDKVYHPETIACWLQVIARNHCLNEVKKEKNRGRHLVSIEAFENCKATSESDGTEVVTKVEFEEYSEILRGLIDNLRDKNRREVAGLFYVKQKSLSEVCSQLNINQNTALSHLRRFRLTAVKTLQRFIEERDTNESFK